VIIYEEVIYKMKSILIDCGREDCQVQVISNDNKVLHNEVVTGKTIIEMFDKCVELANKYDVSEVYIDAYSYGSLAYDYFLREADENKPKWAKKIFNKLPK
jgi:hypothetical protein